MSAAEAAPAPAEQCGPGVLELGADVGAVVAYAAPQRLHEEVEIGPALEPARRTHAEVRERRVPGGTFCAVVFCPVASGTHILWGRDGVPITTVEVAGGRVTEVALDP